MISSSTATVVSAHLWFTWFEAWRGWLYSLPPSSSLSRCVSITLVLSSGSRILLEARESSFSEARLVGFKHVSGLSSSLILLWLTHFAFQLRFLLFLWFPSPFFCYSSWFDKGARRDPHAISVMALGSLPVALITLITPLLISLHLRRMCSPLALFVGLSQTMPFRPPILNSRTSIDL